MSDPAASLFSSRRERRLWICAAVVLATILATIGLVRSLAGFIIDEGLVDAAFSAGLLILMTAIIVIGLKARPHGLEIGVVLGITAVYIFVLARMMSPAERSHIIEYGILAVLIHEALVERKDNGRRVPVPGLLAIGITTFVGVLDETLQILLPDRVFSSFDVFFDFLAALMAVTARTVIGSARRWGERLLRNRPRPDD